MIAGHTTVVEDLIYPWLWLGLHCLHTQLAIRWIRVKNINHKAH